MRVLQIGKSWFPEQQGSGLDRVFYELVNALPEAGVDVRAVVAGSPRTTTAAEDVLHTFAMPTSPLPFRLWAARRLIKNQLSDYAPDIVASHFALYTFPSIDIIRSLPVVIHFHGPWSRESRVEGDQRTITELKRRLELRTYRAGGRFIVLSDAFRELLSNDYGVDPDLIRVIPGGVDCARFATDASRTEARERLGWPRDRPIVVSVRRLVRRMGLENLISAVAILRRTVPDVLVMIAGRGAYQAELEKRVNEMGLDHNVRFVGFVADTDLPLVYRAGDVSVVPSVALEGFGLITIESLAAGTPPVVAPVGGLPEIVEPLSDSLLLPSSEPDAIADRLGAVLRGDIVMPSSERCVEYARKCFDWSVIARRTSEVYSEVVR